MDPEQARPRPGEGEAAAQYQNAFGVKLSRIDPNEYPPGTPRPDFKITEGPNIGKTVDFMFTVDSQYAANGMNNNFLKGQKQVNDMKDTFADHLAKADVVPLDFRSLTTENQRLLMDKVINSLPPADKAKLLIIR